LTGENQIADQVSLLCVIPEFTSRLVGRQEIKVFTVALDSRFYENHNLKLLHKYNFFGL
jgi:hypothetical protein